MSTSPGRMVFPDMSRTSASSGMSTLPLGPIAAMRLSRTTMSPRGITSSPRIVSNRAPLSTTVPRGLSLGTVISTSKRAAS